MKYILPIILLLSSFLLWPPHMEVSAQEAAEAAMPAKADDYASVARIASAANIRSKASLASEVLLAVPAGYPLAILERRGDWVLVEDFMERRGWVFASLLTEHGTVIIKVWKGNLRTGPGLAAKIITKLDHGTILSVVGTRGDWVQVNNSARLSGWLHRNTVWPPVISVSDKVAEETMPFQEVRLPAQTVKEINTPVVKRKVAEPAMPAKTEQELAPTETHEETPEITKATEYPSAARIESEAHIDSKALRSSEVLPGAVPPPGTTHEFSGNISAEGRLFGREPLYPGQERNNGSIAIALEYYHEWPSGSRAGSSFIFSPFLRIDSADSERTHFDIRELNFLLFGDSWELRLGIGKVFWGATEFVHLVDIINQTDLVEDIDGEEKLGQPMVHLSIPRDWGVLDFFLLPYFRERTFPGEKGRLRTPVPVDNDNPIFESGDEEKHVDFSLRYSQAFGWGDMGIYYFRGTNREPTLVPALDSNNQPVILPFYQQIDQVGLDLQLITGNWLWKLESFYRDGQGEDAFYSAVGGFEYTFFGVANSMIDLGFLVEYAYDERNEEATTPFENDLFFGLRLAVNDAAGSELLAGISQDLDDASSIFSLEASRRLTDRLKVYLEAWVFIGAEPGDYYLYSIRDDDFVRLQLFYYF